MDSIRKEMRDLRRDFNYGTLDVSEVPENPIELLKTWLEDAIKLEIKDANAMVLATSTNNQPDTRVLLIRDIVDNGFHFYTNYGSKKARDIEQNSNACVNIFWPEMERQIRMHVTVEKIPETLSDDYFKTRPRDSQIGAWASVQSEELASRDIMEDKIKELEKKFEGKDVPRPDVWGGYIVKPNYYEFWQGRPNRLHDRVTYEQNGENWNTKRLYP